MIDSRAAIGEEEAEWTNVTGKVTGVRVDGGGGGVSSEER